MMKVVLSRNHYKEPNKDLDSYIKLAIKFGRWLHTIDKPTNWMSILDEIELIFNEIGINVNAYDSYTQDPYLSLANFYELIKKDLNDFNGNCMIEVDVVILNCDRVKLVVNPDDIDSVTLSCDHKTLRRLCKLIPKNI